MIVEYSTAMCDYSTISKNEIHSIVILSRWTIPLILLDEFQDEERDIIVLTDTTTKFNRFSDNGVYNSFR